MPTPTPPDAIVLRRLRSQWIEASPAQGPADVVAHMGAIQAQDYPGALWAVALRLAPDSAAATEPAVERALAERTIVRSWPMRGTLHFVHARDLRWMLDLLTPRILAAAAGRRRQLKIDDEALGRSAAVIEQALAGGRSLTRPQIFAALESAGIATQGQRGYHILATLAQRGLICFGARSGKQHTFVLLEEWLPPAPRLARDEALATLARRYFAARGPATVHDFAHWSGLSVGDCRAAVSLAAPGLDTETIGGAPYLLGAGPPAAGLPAAGSPAADMVLLPAFDEWLIGYRDRTATLPPHRAALIQPGAGGILKPVVIDAGSVAGLWTRRIHKGRVRVDAAFFLPERSDLESAAALLQRFGPAAERYARFLGLPLSPEGSAQIRLARVLARHGNSHR